MATINFGIAGPMYGDLSAYGYNVRAGANLAVKHINTRGGIHGRMIATKLFDEAMMPRTAEKVVQDGIRYVVGHPCSWGVDTASEVYEKKGVILISPTATSPELARRGRRYFFRTVGTDIAQAAAACDWIVGNFRPGVKIAVLYEAILLHLATECQARAGGKRIRGRAVRISSSQLPRGL
jgi:branched-chain amino acid transport system substrate-binding protein